MNRYVFGAGINDSDYFVAPIINGKQKMCPYYQIWKDMIRRCYSNEFKEKRPTYADVTVCKEWHSFMAFREWMMRQDWQGKQLDKDILISGNKIYSPDTCIFVTQAVNSLLIDRKSCRGAWPIGVNLRSTDKKFSAKCSKNGKRIYLGIFNDPHDAHREWQKSKIKAIQDAEYLEKESIIAIALNRISKKIINDYESNIETTYY